MPADDPDGPCPLCNSTDIVPVDERARANASKFDETGTAESDEVGPTKSNEAIATKSGEVYVDDSDTDEFVGRLRELRDADERGGCDG